MSTTTQSGRSSQGPNVFAVLSPYRLIIIVLVILAIAANGITLWLPKILSHAIDSFIRQEFVLSDVAWELGILGFLVFLLTYAQTIVQTYVSELVAKDLRNSLIDTLSRQSFSYIQQIGASRLLTNLTTDMDALKMFVSMGVASIISSVVLIIGASVLLLLTNWRLALAVLAIVPVIMVTFYLTLSKVRQLFSKSREVIDRLNRVINESILGSGLVRVLNSQAVEYDKFLAANGDSRDISLKIIRIFAGLIPIISFIASMGTVVLLALGGHFIISGTMSLGDFASFSSYLGILIFPIILLGFVSNIIAQAGASYGRISQVLTMPDDVDTGTVAKTLKGNVEARELVVRYGEKEVLKNISFSVRGGTKTAIIGPTAAGKTQLLYVLTGLVRQQSGDVFFDGTSIDDYDKQSLYHQVGFVFQDSIVFNMSLRENVAFSVEVSDDDLEKAIRTAELSDLIESLPNGLDTVVSERGTSLSGGQKQRLMLARALALDPRILLLDDFTARVDTATEAKILANIERNYPDITLISVTQKVASVERYDHIIVIMEGELLAQGTHRELLASSPEYVQIYESQQSTDAYEIYS